MDSTHEEVKHKKSKVGCEDNDHIGYGLRENPKKSRKFQGFKEVVTSASASAVSASSMEEAKCKVCGKGFESMKALYGHMRHHSGSSRTRIQCKECEKSFLSLKSLTNHMRVHAQKLSVHTSQSETTSSRRDLVVESLYLKKKRSKRIKRYKSINASCSISSLNESLPSFSETDDQEVEQVAVCLMMLSKGVHNWGELHSFSEFSDDDDQAVSFDVKSLNQKKRNLTNDGDESLEMKKPREEKLDACASDSLAVLYEQIEKNDDGLEVCVERLYKGSEFEMPKLDTKSEFVSYDTEIEKGVVFELKFGSSEVESCEDSMEEVGLGIMKSSSSSKKVSFDACDSEFGFDSCNKVKCSSPESETVDDSGEKFRIECKTCNQMFHSRKALGGHQRKHSTRKGCKAQKIESWEEENQTGAPKTEADCQLVKLEYIENLMEGKTSGLAVKEHKCPICFKVFITGQALGGHKRAHIPKNSETRPQEIAMSQDHSTISEALDINIPIMVDQQENGDVGFKQWWVSEPLVAN
ncbi:hypothetical protein Patl1_21806 [Pistacia atlantica]|uniref:Uncharacterized protein n=1 Tax=Pistacia atlantica TaxID=434234 RepID=A0ACC1BNI3_9ROSI|nr:hypothetical protein Patl1_21806 [Pistacia atlantica]